jgi:hypothetical protein
VTLQSDEERFNDRQAELLRFWDMGNPPYRQAELRATPEEHHADLERHFREIVLAGLVERCRCPVHRGQRL